MSLENIEQLAKEHAAHRAVLAERVQALHDEMNAAKRRKLPGIKSAVSDAKDSQLRLLAEIKAHANLFAKPRSRVFHGIKLGFQKAKGKLSFASAEQVSRLIRKHFADQFTTLVKVDEKPVKSALLQLNASQLKLIGCTVTKTGDEAFVKPADSDIDKLVDALLKDKSDSDEAADD